MEKHNHIIYGFWDRVEEVVSASGMVKAEIARQMGYDRRALCPCNRSQILNGHALAKFCAITNVSADWLLGLKSGPRTLQRDTDGQFSTEHEKDAHNGKLMA